MNWLKGLFKKKPRVLTNRAFEPMREVTLTGRWAITNDVLMLEVREHFTKKWIYEGAIIELHGGKC